MDELQLRTDVLGIAREMNSCGLNQGTSGNLSVRWGDGFLLTPSALPYDVCEPEDLVFMDMDGQGKGKRKPSSEWRMHRDMYLARPEAGCVLHAHPIWCTTLACLERDIPPFHYMVAVAGGESVPCAPYRLFGSQELSDAILETMKGRRACLLAHHGLVCCTESLDTILPLAIEIETLAKIYVQALQIQEPPLLSQEQMDQVKERFTSYRP
ncbi:MAG: class II aldolase [Desulfobulbus propionicus]|nr:MAG: class II aldolase [Desulfobulbus propionicus]